MWPIRNQMLLPKSQNQAMNPHLLMNPKQPTTMGFQRIPCQPPAPNKQLNPDGLPIALATPDRMNAFLSRRPCRG
jgi:hypothetical protein